MFSLSNVKSLQLCALSESYGILAKVCCLTVTWYSCESVLSLSDMVSLQSVMSLSDMTFLQKCVEPEWQGILAKV